MNNQVLTFSLELPLFVFFPNTYLGQFDIRYHTPEVGHPRSTYTIAVGGETQRFSYMRHAQKEKERARERAKQTSMKDYSPRYGMEGMYSIDTIVWLKLLCAPQPSNSCREFQNPNDKKIAPVPVMQWSPSHLTGLRRALVTTVPLRAIGNPGSNPTFKSISDTWRENAA